MRPWEGALLIHRSIMTSTDTAKPPKSKRKRRRGRLRTEFADYLLEIKDWSWGFSFGINSMRHWDEPYNDFRHLQVRGTLMLPSKLKAENVEFYFLPDHALNEGQREKHEAKAVGSVTRQRSGKLEASLSMPSDVLPAILQMLIGERFHFITLNRYSILRKMNLNLKILCALWH